MFLLIARLWALLCRLMLLLALGLGAWGLMLTSQRYPVVALLLTGFLAWWRMGRGEGQGWSFGTARYATAGEAARGGLLSDRGILLGTAELLEPPPKWRAALGLLWPFTPSESAVRACLSAFLGSRWRESQFIRIKNYVHVAIFAKTGGGKGVSIFLPNLFSLACSVVVADIKGELYQLTARHRQRRLGQKIFRLDPDGLAVPGQPGDTLNPLDFIDADSEDFLDQCRNLADALVVAEDQTGEHWVDSSRLLLTAFIAFVAGCEPDPKLRNLNTVRVFTASRVAFANAIYVMQQQEAVCGGVIARLGDMLTWYVDRELGSVLTTTQRFVQFLDAPSVQRCVAESSFDPRVLRSGRASLYLCLSHSKVKTLAPLQRLWVGTLLRVLSTDKTGERDKVLFLLDEAAHLGRMSILEDAVTLYRSMGIRLFFAFQSLHQVKTTFGDKADTILDNIGTQQFFGVSNWDAAEAISKRIGERTIRLFSLNKSWSRSRPTGVGGGPGGPPPGSDSYSESHTTSDAGRRLIRPEEILVLADDESLVFHNNLPVVATRLIRYYDHPSFKRGGVGKPRRLGLAAGLAAGSLLTLSLALLHIATTLPPPATRQQNPTTWQELRATPAAGRWQVPPVRRVSRPYRGY